MLINVFGNWINSANVCYLYDRKIASVGYPVAICIIFNDETHCDIEGKTLNEVALAINQKIREQKNDEYEDKLYMDSKNRAGL